MTSHSETNTPSAERVAELIEAAQQSMDIMLLPGAIPPEHVAAIEEAQRDGRDTIAALRELESLRRAPQPMSTRDRNELQAFREGRATAGLASELIERPFAMTLDRAREIVEPLIDQYGEYNLFNDERKYFWTGRFWLNSEQMTAIARLMEGK